MALATELRHREKVMGTTFDYRRGCRILRPRRRNRLRRCL